MRPASISAKPQLSFPTHSDRTIRRNAYRCALTFAVLLALTFAAPPAHAQTFSVLHNFAGGSDGSNPGAGLIEVKGRLYGTTTLGGLTASCPGINSHGCGTVFQLTPPTSRGGSWTETVIYRFQGGANDGANPQAVLLADRAGNLYGTTNSGGIHSCSGGCGTVFELQPPSLPGGAWTETVLYLFKGVPSGNGNGDAAYPNGLVFDKGGNLFGVAYGGGHCKTDETGTYCYGAVFKLSKPASVGDPWTEHILYRFYGPSWSFGNPVFDQAGNLYGTGGWGRFGFGMIFTLQPSTTHRGAWVESEIYSFRGGSGDGAFPDTGLVFDASGRLYGSTLGGGVNQPGFGMVFQLTPPVQSGGAWSESVLYAFTGGSDGDSPYWGPIIDSSGNTYGTTTQAGSAGYGTIYELSAGQEITLHSFSPSDGITLSGLCRDANGTLYGTAQAGGTANFGTVFKLTP